MNNYVRVEMFFNEKGRVLIASGTPAEATKIVLRNIDAGLKTMIDTIKDKYFMILVKDKEKGYGQYTKIEKLDNIEEDIFNAVYNERKKEKSILPLNVAKKKYEEASNKLFESCILYGDYSSEAFMQNEVVDDMIYEYKLSERNEENVL